MPVKGIQSIAQNPSWLQKELKNLRNKTVLLFFFGLLFSGSLFGYFVVSEVIYIVRDPVKNVSHAYAGESNLKVNVETKEPTMVKIEYGTTEDALNERPVSVKYDMEHSVLIKGLLPDKAHSYRVVLQDEEGNTHKSDFFTAD